MATEHRRRRIWINKPRDPELPGDTLGCVMLEDGEAIFYDRSNPAAYIQGDAHEIGAGGDGR